MMAATMGVPRRRRGRFARFNLSARIGAAIVLGFTLIAIGAPLLAPYDPLASDWMAVLQAPSLAHPMGTDDLGRDVLSRAIWGAQTSLVAGVASVLIALGIGVPLGIVAGYFRGWIDTVVTRLADTLLACPQVMLAIALAMFLGGSLVNASIAIGVSTVPVFVRLARAKTIEESSAVYVEAAVSVGNPTRRLLLRAPASQHRAAAHRPGGARHRGGDHRRGRVVVPRSWPRTAGAFLGLDVDRRQGLHRECALAVRLAGALHLPDGHRLQSARRRAEKGHGPTTLDG